MKFGLFIGVAAISIILLSPFAARLIGGEPFTIVCQENVYAGRSTPLAISGLPFSAPLDWNAMAAGRLLASGRAESDARGHCSLELSLPELRDGAALKGELNLAIKGEKATKTLSIHSRKIAAEGSPCVTAKPIGIFPPITPSPLSKALDSCGFKTEQVESIADFKGDILIASGIDFEDSQTLFSSLMKFAEGGHLAILSAPLRGTIQFKPPPLESMLFSKSLPGLAQRVETASIASDLAALPQSAAFSLEPDDGNSLQLRAHKMPAKNDAYAFCRLQLPSGGAVVIMGWDLPALSEASPAPLLALRETFKTLSIESDKGR